MRNNFINCNKNFHFKQKIDKSVDHPFKSPVGLSFCTGSRMLERGVERALYRINQYRSNYDEGTVQEIHPVLNIAAYVEIEAFIIANLVEIMEKGLLAPAPVWSNLKTFPSADFYRKIHIIIGGYPCQPFSKAGKRKGHEDPRHLWPFIRTSIAAIRPICCFFENVEDHLTMGFPEVYKDLRALGYTVEAGIFSASEVGAPHERRRLFIFAMDDTAKQGLEAAGFAEFWKLRQEAGERLVDRSKFSGDDVADTHSCNSGSGTERTGRQEGTDVDWSRQESKLADTDIIGCGHGEEEHGEHGIDKIGELPIENKEGNEQCGVSKSGTDVLANTPGAGQRTGSGEVSGEGRPVEGKEQREDGERSGALPGNSSTDAAEELANTNSAGSGQDNQQSELRTGSTIESSRHSGLSGSGEDGEISTERIVADTESIGTQGLRPAGEQELQFNAQKISFVSSSGTNRWPARPGEQQYDWEAPRVVESGLGCTIDGYNFRSDLLRMYGNGVVPDSAEVAFLILLNQHFKIKLGYGKFK